MSSSADEPTAFGLRYRQHDNRQMQRILGAYNSLPKNPTVRSAVYANLVVLEKKLDQNMIGRIKEWMRNGGILQDFPVTLSPRNVADESETFVQHVEHAESSFRGWMTAEDIGHTDTTLEFNKNSSGPAGDVATDYTYEREDRVGGHAVPQNLINRPVESTKESKECCICIEVQETTEFLDSSKITSTCNHADDSLVCLRCIRETIRTAVRDGAIHSIACPLCPSKLSHHEIALFSNNEILNRYEYLVIRSTPGMAMCLGPECGLGQVHNQLEDAPPVMICNSCGFKTCMFHKLPWHEGRTCIEFDQEESQIERLEADEATAKLLSGSSKICPTCKQGVTKEEGCNHLQCRCGEEWCFLWLASWENILRIGATAHARTCAYHPDRVSLRVNQRDSNAARMARLVHGGPVSETLERARLERNAARRAAGRILAAEAAEKRIAAMTEESEKAESSSGPSVQVQKRKVKLVPVWEEK